MTAMTLPAPTPARISGVIRSEVRKFLSTRLWWIMALSLVGYMTFMAAMMSFAFNFDADMVDPEMGMPDAREIATSIYTLAPAFGYVFPLIVGAISITSEFRHQTITPTLLAEPRRTRLVAAKLIASLPVGLVVGILGSLTCWAVGGATITLMGGEAFLFDPETIRIVLLSTLTLTIWAMVGVGFGTAIPNQIGSIIIVLAFTQFVEPIARMAIAQVDAIAPASKFLPGAAGEALAGGSFYGTMMPIDALEWWQGGLVLIGYAVLFAFIGRITTFRKDIG